MIASYDLTCDLIVCIYNLSCISSSIDCSDFLPSLCIKHLVPSSFTKCQVRILLTLL